MKWMKWPRFFVFLGGKPNKSSPIEMNLLGCCRILTVVVVLLLLYPEGIQHGDSSPSMSRVKSRHG
jgi:hypothetical protein